MMDPEYTRVQLVRKIKVMLNLIDQYIEDSQQDPDENAQLSEFSEVKDPRK